MATIDCYISPSGEIGHGGTTGKSLYVALINGQELSNFSRRELAESAVPLIPVGEIVNLYPARSEQSSYSFFRELNGEEFRHFSKDLRDCGLDTRLHWNPRES